VCVRHYGQYHVTCIASPYRKQLEVRVLPFALQDCLLHHLVDKAEIDRAGHRERERDAKRERDTDT
jgi:hypothetical protein